MATITLDPFIGDDEDEAGTVCILVNGQDVERFTPAEARTLAAALVDAADEAAGAEAPEPTQTTELSVVLTVTDTRRALSWLLDNGKSGGILTVDDDYADTDTEDEHSEDCPTCEGSGRYFLADPAGGGTWHTCDA